MNPKRWILLAGGLVFLPVLGWCTFIWGYYYSDFGITDRINLDPSALDLRVTRLHEDVFVLRGAGGNVTAITAPDGVFVIDTDLPFVFPELSAALAEISDAPVRYVANTHVHFDHSGANPHFRDAGADILSLAGTAEAIRDDPNPARREGSVPNRIVTDGEQMLVGNQTLTFIEMRNAHTNSDLVIHVMPADVIVTGDIYVQGGLPYLDRALGGTLANHLKSQDEILALAGPDTIIVPGHGAVSDREELGFIRDRLGRAHDYIAWLAQFDLDRRWVMLAHPLHDWPLSKYNGHLWERYWVTLVINGLQDE